MGDKNWLACRASNLEANCEALACSTIGMTTGVGGLLAGARNTVAKFFLRKEIAVWFTSCEKRLKRLWRNSRGKKAISPLTLSS